MLDLLRPDMMAEAIWEIPLDELRGRGIEGLIVDLDNTIVDWNRNRVRQEVQRWLQKASGMGMRVCIASNARSKARVSAIADEVGALWLAPAGKPSRRGLRQAMAMLGVTPDAAALVGDQLFTDVMGGNRLGLFTILVRPLSGRDFPATRIMRILEWFVLRRLRGSVKEAG
ncbi:MAG: YqeG family HAD IIIA-type phosphatase [Armatimonadota bacterium]|nr:MAG: YqeG family HAD IIIA-type phosphatase [Armatimonadota bacterium]